MRLKSMFVCWKTTPIKKITHRITQGELPARLSQINRSQNEKQQQRIEFDTKPHGAALRQSDAQGGRRKFELSGTYQRW